VADDLFVEIPGRLPPSQNARQHYMAHAKAMKEARERARDAATDAVAAAEWQPPPRAEVHAWVIVPDERKRDIDNAVASLKPYLDGLVDGGVLKGDSWFEVPRLSVVFELRPGQRGVVFRVVKFRELAVASSP
jgi:hypothetical protein